MKILMLTPYVPYPPSSGGQIRTYNLLKYLSKEHEITLVCLYKKDNEKKYFNHLRQHCKKIYLCRRPHKPWQVNIILKTVLSRLPFLIVRNFSEEASSIIKKILSEEKYDVIHAETFYIMPHIPETSTPILLVEQTIEYEVYRHFINSVPSFLRMFFNIDIAKLKHWERYYWRKADVVAAVSKTDVEIIRKLEPDIKTAIVPNGAGDDMFTEKLSPKNLQNPQILFQGNFYWLQNVEAANFLINKIYPKLTNVCPEARITISGQNAGKIPHANVKGLEIVDINSDDINTVKKLYQQASLFIAPIFGPGGTRLKILAAMASGVPVVSTKTGIEGLGVKNNIHALIAHDADEFIEKISYILKNKDEYEKIRKNAYHLVKENYSWSKIAHKLEMVYKNIKTYEDRD
jgi:glycosyltransferase involved in cell wall biosynthesis